MATPADSGAGSITSGCPVLWPVGSVVLVSSAATVVSVIAWPVVVVASPVLVSGSLGAESPQPTVMAVMIPSQRIASCPRPCMWRH